MPRRIRIRDARPGELDRVALLLKSAYEQYAPLMPAEAWESYSQDIMDVRSRLSESQLIVAEADGKLAGSVTLFLNPAESWSPWPPGWAGIRLLAVHPAFRNRGIGRVLMEECVRRSRAAGLKAIGLHTTAAMDVARRLYEKMGFVRVPEFDIHPDDRVTVMAYRLDI